ncbi:MAG: exonuclease SbcCD subunit D [Dehalococcoidia bacterium]|nr:MAG: exonuclease SbcCD subunit D [Dehalococcoidia bacterium]
MKILHFADLHLGVESYGRLDPTTGLSSRLGDFLAAFDQLVAFALENRVDLALFCGDAYKSREPTQTHQREFARRIRRLAEGGIPVFLLTGNHDLPSMLGRATATEIFDTLGVANVYVSNKPELYRIPTKSGAVQVVSLPWLRRSQLLSREDTADLKLDEIDRLMEEKLTGIVAAKAAELDPALPAILAAHAWVEGARVGSETMMSIGQEPHLLPSNLTRPGFDYIALGHIHRRQVLNETPPAVYSGSLERVDFSEENDEKGFYIIELDPRKTPGRRVSSFEFKEVEGRRFLTIRVAIEDNDSDPTQTVLDAINSKKAEIDGAIVRLQISLTPAAAGQLGNNEIRQALGEAYYLTITKDIKRDVRLRLGSQTSEGIKPLEALKAYLEQRQDLSKERVKLLLEHGEKIIAEHQNPD